MPTEIILPGFLTAIFSLLGVWHLYWAGGGVAAKSGAIPEAGGRPAFIPSRASTAGVGVALLACALLIATCGNLLSLALPVSVGSWLCYALSLLLALRAIGDFRWVGFFKRERGSVFARRDSWIYSPLCTVLSVGVFFVGHGYGG